MKDVCSITGMSSEDYFMLQVDAGIEYLDYKYHDEHIIRDSLRQSKGFWLWWRELWFKADKQFMMRLQRKAWGWEADLDGVNVRMLHKEQVLRYYRHCHNPKSILIYPNWQLIKMSISQLNKVQI